MARNRWFPEDDEADDANAPPLSCWLCGRDLGQKVEWHHPVPKSKGGKGKETVPVHPICLQAIHANFTNAEMARIGDNVAVLRENDAVAKFLEWIAGKEPDFHVPTRGGGKRR
jgi:hypothetical protein